MGREGEKEGLLAVLLGDLYTNNLAPLTLNSPLSLLPVAGRPLLDITLDSLRLAGVTEVNIYEADKRVTARLFFRCFCISLLTPEMLSHGWPLPVGPASHPP